MNDPKKYTKVERRVMITCAVLVLAIIAGCASSESAMKHIYELLMTVPLETEHTTQEEKQGGLVKGGEAVAVGDLDPLQDRAAGPLTPLVVPTPLELERLLLSNSGLRLALSESGCYVRGTCPPVIRSQIDCLLPSLDVSMERQLLKELKNE